VASCGSWVLYKLTLRGGLFEGEHEGIAGESGAISQ
jgi:hypothetical protein